MPLRVVIMRGEAAKTGIRKQHFLAAVLGRPKLSAIMSLLFVCLSIPILLFILAYNYYMQSAAIMSTLRTDVAKTKQASIENSENLIRPVESTLRLLAESASSNPTFFKTEQSRELLFRALTSAAQIDAVYVSFEDGYHRVVTRIDDDRRRSDPKIPVTANWHSSYIDEFSAGKNRARHRTFFDTWPHVVGQYDVVTTMDVRAYPGWEEAKHTGTLAVTRPAINPDTGYPIIFLRFPIISNGEFIGCASANITMDILSRFLASHRASPHSTAVIADKSDGTIIALPEKKSGVRTVAGRLEVAKLDDIADDNVRAAYRLHGERSEDNFLFRSPVDGQEWSALFADFPEDFKLPWQVIVLTPTDDFVGTLKAANRQILVVIIFLIAAELLLIYFLSRRLSRPIESVSQELKSVEGLSFERVPRQESKIREIAQLESAAALLRSSLKSFSSFVPLDIVRQLIKSGTPLTLGVEPRLITIFFSDLQDFSTHAERLAPNELLDQMSAYFEEVSRAISNEQGTVDKFIGDGVMAFWGAPIAQPDHALRACVGALRATRRMEKLNETWVAEGRPRLRIRIGLNSASVLVGNVGSSQRLSYTVMGDGVNVAARLEGVNKLFGTTICISDSVYDATATSIVARPLRRIQVKGRESAFMVYTLVGIEDSDDPELRVRGEDRKLVEMTWAASNYFERGNRAEATREYRRILEAFPGDSVATALLRDCATDSESLDAIYGRERQRA